MAIVGARKCTSYGENIAYSAAYALAKRGVIIVSGLAYGIDSCAHRGCLDAGGITIAVLGTAIDNIHPRSNTKLAERILERGAILSEYPPEMETRAYYFQIRNRIVAGVADAVLVVEASTHSGTQGTYEAAIKMGKDVFAVPGDLTRPMSAGTNLMLRDGALPYIDETDIMLRLGMRFSDKAKYDFSDRSLIEQKICAAIKCGFQHPDEIIANLDISVVDFNTSITILELDGVVKRQGQIWTIV